MVATVGLSERKLLMVMELAPGTELFDAILARAHFDEADARPIFLQMAVAS